MERNPGADFYFPDPDYPPLPITHQAVADGASVVVSFKLAALNGGCWSVDWTEDSVEHLRKGME